MKFNYKCDNFTEEQGAELLARAAERRHNGRLKQAELSALNEQMNNVFTMADTFDNNEQQILTDYIEQHPEQIANIRDYVESQGYSPEMNLIELCMQVAHARNKQIEEVQASYDADNFSFSSEAGRQRRKARKEQRLTRKLSKLKGTDAEAAAIATEPEQKDYIVNDPNNANVTNPLPPEGTNITRDEAHAEILGQEAEFEEYDGEQDKFLPVLNAAIALGTKTVNEIKAAKAQGKKINLKAFADLFKRKADEVAKEAIANIETEKKRDFARENAPIIIVAALALVLIGSMIK